MIDGTLDGIGRFTVSFSITGVLLAVAIGTSIPVLNGAKEAFFQISDSVLKWARISFAGLWLVAQITVLPIRIFGLGTYLTWVWYIGGGILALYIFGVLGVFLFKSGILGKIGGNTWHEISMKSVPVILIAKRLKAVEEGLCPIIQEETLAAD